MLGNREKGMKNEKNPKKVFSGRNIEPQNVMNYEVLYIPIIFMQFHFCPIHYVRTACLFLAYLKLYQPSNLYIDIGQMGYNSRHKLHTEYKHKWDIVQL